MSGRCIARLHRVAWCRCRLSDLHIIHSAGWISATFLDGEDAETDLSADRPRSMQRKDIMELIPKGIKKHIVHPGVEGQIWGFEELFVHLERSTAAGELRRLIIDYFTRSPSLRGHLSQLFPLSRPLKSRRSHP